MPRQKRWEEEHDESAEVDSLKGFKEVSPVRGDCCVELLFSATFKLEKETKNTVRYAEEAEGRRPVVGTVYIDKYELPKPFPEKIRVTIEPA